MTTPRLVLWDVDHTLIDTGGIGREIYADAFEKATGHPLHDIALMYGRTEGDLFRATLESHGLTNEPGLFDRFAAYLADGYTTRAPELRTRGQVLPGVIDALTICAGHNEIAQTVLTGNTREAAELKLTAFDLDRHLDLAIGAYGSDADHRPRLVNIARTRAMQATGHYYTETTTVIIGDTVNDVLCGLESGAYVIAIATGATSTTELTEAGADAVFADLTQPDVIPAILGETSR